MQLSLQSHAQVQLHQQWFVYQKLQLQMKTPRFQGYRVPLPQLLTRSAGGTERKQTCPSRSASSPTVPLEQAIQGDKVCPLLIED